MNLLMKILLFILAGLVLAVLVFSSRYFNPSYYEGKTVVALGDSLTFGIGAATDENYVSRLARNLNIRMFNKGLNDDTTKEGLSRIQSDVLDLKPDVVIILLGANDFLKNIPLSETKNNLAKILDILKEHKIKVVLVGIHQQFLSNYEKMYQDLAREKGVAGYVPGILSGLYQHPQYMFNDFHPNAAGYQIVAERIEPVLRRVLISRNVNSIPKRNFF